MNYREEFKNLPLSNAFMFAEVLRQKHICKLFLEALLGRKVDRIEYASKEETISDTYLAHGIRLDVYFEDGTSIYNVEMQATMQRCLEKRIRYYQSTMDRRALEQGKDYEELPDSYIIFVCDYDSFGAGLAVYRRKSVIEGREDLAYDDGSPVYILNSRYKKANASPAILEFLQCIRENDVDSV